MKPSSASSASPKANGMWCMRQRWIWYGQGWREQEVCEWPNIFRSIIFIIDEVGNHDLKHVNDPNNDI